MSTHRSANSAYYASKSPLDLRGTKEGRKNVVNFPSYRHAYNDSTKPSSKYYATPVSEIVKLKKENKLTEIDAGVDTLTKLIELFADGFTDIIVKGSKEEIAPCKAAVDLAVGQQRLTREQADSVSFVLKLPATQPDPEPVKVKAKKASKRKAAKKSKPVEQVKSDEDKLITEADLLSILNPGDDSDDE